MFRITACKGTHCAGTFKPKSCKRLDVWKGTKDTSFQTLSKTLLHPNCEFTDFDDECIKTSFQFNRRGSFGFVIKLFGFYVYMPDIPNAKDLNNITPGLF